RSLSALMLPDEPHGIESALSRCKTLGIDESKSAFGKIASFLSEGDLAGAAAVLPKWDEKAKSDPYYQLTAGAMLERAGDVRAIGRYQQAFDLEPDLVVARVFHSELVTLELGIETGKPVLDEAVQRLGGGPIARAPAAYEALEPSELESAAAAMSAMSANDGVARALTRGLGIVMGKTYPAPAALEQMAVPSVPWGDFVAVDAALDTGNLALAE